MFTSRAFVVAIVIATSFACGGGPGSPTPGAPSPPAAPPAVPFTVSVVFPDRNSCSPLPDKPCTVSAAAQASTPGDVAAYAWSGCATGTAREAVCTFDRPGTVTTATVEVRHRDGRTASASAQMEGVNHPPVIGIGYIEPTPNSMEVSLLGAVSDPDEFIGNVKSCEATVTGFCKPQAYVLHCGDGLFGTEIAVHRTADAGTCTVAITAKDSWDLRTTLETTFDIATLLSKRAGFARSLDDADSSRLRSRRR